MRQFGQSEPVRFLTTYDVEKKIKIDDLMRLMAQTQQIQSTLISLISSKSNWNIHRKPQTAEIEEPTRNDASICLASILCSRCASLRETGERLSINNRGRPPDPGGGKWFNELHFVNIRSQPILCNTMMLTLHFIPQFRSPSRCKNSGVTFIQLRAFCSVPAIRSISTAGRSSKRCFTQLIHCAPLLT